MKSVTATIVWLLACLLLAPASAQAQGAGNTTDYPKRSVKVVVPYAPGGGLDTVARIVTQKLTELLGQPFVVENKPGAATIIGNDTVAKSAPDGYTLLFAAAPIAMNQVLGLKTPYDVQKDFAPISLVAGGGVVIFVHPSTPYKTMQDIVQAAKASPDGLFYGSAGVGSMPHLIGEYWKVESGANLTHVAFKGSSPAMQAAVAGDVKILLDAWIPSGSQIESGKLRPIAYAAPARSKLMPNVPTTAEQGFPNMVGGGFFGLMAPAGTPQPIIDKVSGAVRDITREGEVRDRLTNLGYDVHGTTPAEYAAYIRRQIERWTPIVKAADIKPE
jgi:tripartite-type tricarboxylate transporter receptor subunit TctC